MKNSQQLQSPDDCSDPVSEVNILEQQLAGVRSQLGEYFISPKSIEQHLDTTYSDQQLRDLAGAVPSGPDLKWIRDNKYLLLPGPPRSIAVAATWGNTIHSPVGDWIVVGSEAVPGSCNKIWAEQQLLLNDKQELASLADACYAWLMFIHIQDRQFDENISLRPSQGNCVITREIRDGLLLVDELTSQREFATVGVVASFKRR